MRGSQIAVSGGEGDAASEAGSSGSSEPPVSVTTQPLADLASVNVSPGVKLVIGDDEETMKSVSIYTANWVPTLGGGVIIPTCCQCIKLGTSLGRGNPTKDVRGTML